MADFYCNASTTKDIIALLQAVDDLLSMSFCDWTYECDDEGNDMEVEVPNSYAEEQRQVLQPLVKQMLERLQPKPEPPREETKYCACWLCVFRGNCSLCHDLCTQCVHPVPTCEVRQVREGYEGLDNDLGEHHD